MRTTLYLGLAALLALAVGIRMRAAATSGRALERPVDVPQGARAYEVSADGATVGERFAPPDGFERVECANGSFGAFLRGLSLRPAGSPVRLHTGALKRRQDVHAAVIDLDVGAADLQQCADAVMRLRAEHLYAAGRMDEIAFHFTSGFRCAFADWRQGRRPRIEGARVAAEPGGPVDDSHAALRRYLDVVFTYAGTASLPRDVEPLPAGSGVAPGDLYLRPGSPGHAMLVLDVAQRGAQGGGTRAVLLAQSYMPAQDIHVVRNPARPRCAWFVVGAGPRLVTPEWTFAWCDVRRFRGPP